MNIGLVTCHSTHNYGAMLQAYGLQQAIRRLGHQAAFIHHHPDRVENNNRRRRPVRTARDLANRMAFLALHKPLRRRYERFEHFRRAYISVTERYRSAAELIENPPRFDAYVCGSDQIWNVENGLSEINFLQFVPEGGRRISYAPSFGTETIPERYERPIAGFLKKFHALSVRERSGQRIIKRISGLDAQLVLDPTFLEPRSTWDRLAVKPDVSEPYIAFYSLEVGPEVSALVARISRTLRLPVVVLGKPGTFMLKGRTFVRIDGGPAEFLGWIRDAELVITNSFHGTVFAMIFDRPFVTLRHSTRSTRMENLLALVGSEHRMFGTEKFRLSDELWSVSADERAQRDDRIAKMREDSLRYLRRALSSGAIDSKDRGPEAAGVA